MGRILSGSCHINDRCILMPKRIPMEILNIYLEDEEKTIGIAGENIRLKLKDFDENVNKRKFFFCIFNNEII